MESSLLPRVNFQSQRMVERKKQAAKPDEQRDNRGTDLFVWLDSLWNKKQHEGTPPTFMMHRFLAADKDLAPFCQALAQEVQEPKLVHRIWQGLLPRGKGAPRLAYVAPKKAPAMEALATRMCLVLSERRRVVEETIAIVESAGRLPALYREFGIEPE